MDDHHHPRAFFSFSSRNLGVVVVWFEGRGALLAQPEDRCRLSLAGFGYLVSHGRGEGDDVEVLWRVEPLVLCGRWWEMVVTWVGVRF